MSKRKKLFKNLVVFSVVVLVGGGACFANSEPSTPPNPYQTPTTNPFDAYLDPPPNPYQTPTGGNPFDAYLDPPMPDADGNVPSNFNGTNTPNPFDLMPNADGKIHVTVDEDGNIVPLPADFNPDNGEPDDDPDTGQPDLPPPNIKTWFV